MKKALAGKFRRSLWLVLATSVFFAEIAQAQRTLDEVAPAEVTRLGYRDKGELARQFDSCLELQIRTMKEEGCNNNDCFKAHPEWLSGQCDKHTAAMFFLTSLLPPRRPIGAVLDEARKGDYLKSYAASCQQGYKVANPDGDISRATAICACAANQSLDLIEYNDFVAFESKAADQEVVDGIKNRAAYARFLCENRPEARSGQSFNVGTPVADRNSGAIVPNAGGVNHARLYGMFERLQKQGGELYNSLLVKLKAEAQDKNCGDAAVCNRVNETFGAIYKDVLYTVYATEIYRFADQRALPPARDKLNDFIKVALLSVEQNIKSVKSISNQAQGVQSGRALLTKALSDAEECQKLLLAIRLELEKP